MDNICLFWCPFCPYGSFLTWLETLLFKTSNQTSPLVQWLRLNTSNAEDIGLIPSGETKVPHAEWQKKKKKKVTEEDFFYG